MSDALGRVFAFAIIAIALWVLVPRTSYWGDNMMAYSVTVSSCNDHGMCNVKAFHPPFKLRVDKQRSEVVWLNMEDGSVGSWNDCTIADKENWSCSVPPVRMKDGLLQSNIPTIKFIPGYAYRMYWLVSSLPDLTGKRSAP